MKEELPGDEGLDRVAIPRRSTRPQHPPRVVAPPPPPRTSDSSATAHRLAPATGGYGALSVVDWYMFLLELRTSIAAGMPFVETVRMLASGHSRRSLRRMCKRLLLLLQEGRGTEDALRQSKEMPILVRQLIVAGVRGGDLPGTLDLAVQHFRWLVDFRRRLLRELIYPASLVVLGTLVMIMRDTAIANLTQNVPVMDALLHYTVVYGQPIMVAVIAAVLLAWLVYTPVVKPWFDRVVLTMPVIGKMVHHYSMMMFYRVLSLLYRSGMPITQAWPQAVQAVPNDHIAQQLAVGVRYLQDGEPLATALRHTRAGMELDHAGVTVAEASGSVPEMLQRMAKLPEQALTEKRNFLAMILGLLCLPLVAMGFFLHPMFLGLAAFLLVFARRMF